MLIYTELHLKEKLLLAYLHVTHEMMAEGLKN